MSVEAYSESFDYFLQEHYVSDQEKLRRKAKGFLTLTRLPREIRKIKEKKNGIFYSEEVFRNDPAWKIAEDSSFTGCAWDINHYDQTIAKGIAVEALSNGSIIVRGAPNATSLLLYKEWKNDTQVLLKALKKAVVNPMTIVFKSYFRVIS